MSLTIFTNETSDTSKDAKVANDGTIQIDIFGILDGADFVTSCFDNSGNAIQIRDFSWLSSKGDVLDATAGDGAVKLVHKRNLKFEIINSGASTDITASVTHSSGDISIIT